MTHFDIHHINSPYCHCDVCRIRSLDLDEPRDITPHGDTPPLALRALSVACSWLIAAGEVGTLLIGVGGLLAAIAILYAAFGPWFFVVGCGAWGILAAVRHRSGWPLVGAVAGVVCAVLAAHLALWLAGIGVWLLGRLP